jgi:hypothetical protein
MKRYIPKPFSKMTAAEKITEAKAAIERLSHPHNRDNRSCQEAIRRWQDTLKVLEGEPSRSASHDDAYEDKLTENFRDHF